MNRKRYAKELKVESVRQLESGAKKASELAMELGIRRNMIYKWQKEVQKHGEERAFVGPGSRQNVPEMQAELTRLRRELALVTEQRDILKKVKKHFEKRRK